MVALAIATTLAVVAAFLNSDVAFLFSATFFLLAAFFASISLSSFFASSIDLFTDFNLVAFFFSSTRGDKRWSLQSAQSRVRQGL